MVSSEFPSDSVCMGGTVPASGSAGATGSFLSVSWPASLVEVLAPPELSVCICGAVAWSAGLVGWTPLPFVGRLPGDGGVDAVDGEFVLLD